jgi:hypothetical protein
LAVGKKIIMPILIDMDDGMADMVARSQAAAEYLPDPGFENPFSSKAEHPGGLNHDKFSRQPNY